MSIETTVIENLVDEWAALFKKLVRLRHMLQNPPAEISAGHLVLMEDQEAAMTHYCTAIEVRIAALEKQIGIYCE